MKTKAKLILKSLADLPANALALAASVPGRALATSRQVLAPSAAATRQEIRFARQRSQEFMTNLLARANAPFQSIHPWSRGGLNE